MQFQVSVKHNWLNRTMQYSPQKKGMHISTKVFFKQPKEIFHIVLFFVENALVWQQINEKGGS